jgi:hypothetical protein
MSHSPIRPLGLPTGSIRAILALVVVTVACQQMLRGEPPSLLLAETLMIVLTHYFTSRRQFQIGDALHERLLKDGVLPAEENPLWLPKGSVRWLIVAVFGLTVLALLVQGRLFDSNVLVLLGPFAAYLLGAWLGRKRRNPNNAAPGRLKRLFIHLLALVVVLIALLLLLLALNDQLPGLPDWAASLLLSAILYYFGAR